jgi:uncharacterized repeat protein (TIGR03803 family)
MNLGFLSRLNGSLYRARTLAVAVALVMTFVLVFVITPAVQAQTFSVIHTFSGSDGSYPQTGLTADGAGNFYGTTVTGGYLGPGCYDTGCGTVYQLTPSGSGWVLNTLYSFTGSPDGYGPAGRVALAQDGSLYGTAQYGGIGNCFLNYGCGTVFQLTMSPGSSKAPWKQTVVHSFTGRNDGGSPQGDLTFDQSGNIYGIAGGGGSPGGDYIWRSSYSCGTVYQLTPSGDGWVISVLHYFRMELANQSSADGSSPRGGVVLDKSGNPYGITLEGGRIGFGTVYRLLPSGANWREQIIDDFTMNVPYNGAAGPVGGLIFDSSGNLYGTTSYGGDPTCNPPYGCGTVFELAPSNGGWVFRILYSFSGCSDWCAPHDKLVMDAAGNLYGTTAGDGAYGAGNVFKLTPAGPGWVYTSLHDFTGQYSSDGAFPTSSLVLDGNGNLYGTTSQGGSSNDGVVFEITP